MTQDSNKYQAEYEDFHKTLITAIAAITMRPENHAKAFTLDLLSFPGIYQGSLH